MAKNLKLFNILLIICMLQSCGLGKDPNNTVVEEFYPNGIIKTETPVKNGLRNGLVKHYSEKGKLISTAEYVNDLRNGQVINYSSDNGLPMLKAMFKDDVQHGQVIQYYREGMLFRESTYVNGRVDGLVKTYWPDGKIKAENLFKMGKPALGLKEFNKDGNPVTNQPHILIKVMDQSEILHKVQVKISLSETMDETDFYLDDSFDGQFLSTDAYKLRNMDGTAYIDYPVPGGTTYNKKLSVVVKFRTKLGNTMLLHKNYNLRIGGKK